MAKARAPRLCRYPRCMDPMATSLRVATKGYVHLDPASASRHVEKGHRMRRPLYLQKSANSAVGRSGLRRRKIATVRAGVVGARSVELPDESAPLQEQARLALERLARAHRGVVRYLDDPVPLGEHRKAE